MAGEMATTAGCMHPTGIHSCFGQSFCCVNYFTSQFSPSVVLQIRFISTGVGKILGYDINTEAHLIAREQKNLLDQCKEAQADIQQEIIERKEKFHIKVIHQSSHTSLCRKSTHFCLMYTLNSFIMIVCKNIF